MKPTLHEVRAKFIDLGFDEMHKLADPATLEAWFNDLGWTSAEIMTESNRYRDAQAAERQAEYNALRHPIYGKDSKE